MWSTSCDLLLLILGSLHISGMGAARDCKFGMPIDRLAYKPKNAKAGQKGRGVSPLSHFYNFGTPLCLWNG